MFIVQLLFFQVVLFVALAIILRRLMGKHATTATAHLQGLTSEYLRKQEELKKRLEEAERQYQELMLKSQEEGKKAKHQILQEAEIQKAKLLEEAHQEAQRIMEQATQARETLQKELVSRMEAQVLDKARELIESLLPLEIRELAHTRSLEELIRNGTVEKIRPALKEKVEKVSVVSAFPLLASQQEQLQRKLQELLGQKVVLEEKVDPSMIAGLTITLGNLVLDGSLALKLRKKVRDAKGTDA